MKIDRFHRERLRLGQIIGLFSALLCGFTSLAFALSLWLNHPHERSTILVFLGLLFLSALALFASLKRRPIVLIAVFVVSFLPVGLYLALHPHWARLAGLAPLGYLVAAWLIGHRPKRLD